MPLNVGAVRSMRSPSIKTISETMALLQVTGGGTKEVKALLNEMLDTQKNNERVLGEAQKAVSELNRVAAKANSSEEAAKYAKAEADNARAKLQADEQRAEDKSEEIARNFNRRELDLTDGLKRLDAENADLKKAKATLADERTELSKNLADARRRQAEASALTVALQSRLDLLTQIDGLFRRNITEAQRTLGQKIA